jgi:ribonucleoside-diphosphate reductase alpha chain
MMDYIFRRLALDYLPYDVRSSYGIFTSAERANSLESGDYAQAQPIEALESEPAPKSEKKPVEVKIESAPINVGSSTELLEKISGVKSDAPLCVTCGVKMRASGACYVCEGCGSTSGCS